MNRTTTRRITAIIAIPAATVGVLLAGLGFGGQAAANAQPMGGTGCGSMPMTGGQGGVNPSAMTRAGQIVAAQSPGASDGAMAVDCQPASHS